MSNNISTSELPRPDAVLTTRDAHGAAASPRQIPWHEVWRVYSEAATVRMLLLGFSAGLPLLTRWLGRRRSWLLLSQASIMLTLVAIALTDPRLALLPMVWCALAAAFGSATQDIALDAFHFEVFGRGAATAACSGRRDNR